MPGPGICKREDRINITDSSDNIYDIYFFGVKIKTTTID
jgi:hypothetical protein